ncbi:MAG: dTDP-4-dehydrorhamnose 3,5-epimerase [Acidobacteriota bacterium]
MGLHATSTAIADVLVIEPAVYGDARGYFFECWHSERYAELGLPARFVQDNVSRSVQGTLRGLHLQEPFGQGKLVQVLDGEIFDVAVDVRRGSPTFGRWAGERLSSDNHRQMYVPPGLAHGFCVLSASALVSYKCTELYHPETEISILWNDEAVGVKWPISSPILSKKDASGIMLADVPQDKLPQWRP